jgi:hypothetical protein
MSIGDWAGAASAVFAGIALIFAGRQLSLLNRQARDERRAALDGVAVSWQTVESPRQAEPDGTAQWVYQIEVTNPGRMPIDHVAIRWIFPVPVQRRRFDGTLDPAATELTLNTPVLAGGGRHIWRCRLRIDVADQAALTDAFAEVRFRDVDGEAHHNRWPRDQRG